MSKKLCAALLAALLLTWQISADTKTKVLQNGLEGYNGCEDTHIAYQFYDNLTVNEDALNHEGEDKLRVKSCVS